MTKMRDTMTDIEHEKLVQVGNEFWMEFSQLCAKHICRMPEELQSVTIAYLGDLTSIYGSQYEKFLKYPKGKS